MAATKASITTQRRPLWALVISGLFHPLLMPTYILLLLVAVDPYLFGAAGLGDERPRSILLLVFLDTFVIPVFAIFIMVRLNMVSSWMMEKSTERIGPLLLVMVVYFWIFWNFSQSNQTPELFTTSLLGVIVALILTFVINLLDKISLHATGMGGLVGVALILFGRYAGEGLHLGATVVLGLPLVLAATLLLAGLVGSARLALGAHSRMQLYTGYLVGLVSQFVALNVWTVW